MSVAVIVRTKGDTARAASLRRAIASVLTQERVQLELIVVFNGARYDRKVLTDVKSDERIQTIVLERPDLARATQAGRAAVSAKYYAFLDDDDELLPGALSLRVDFLNEHADVDCLVTNGEYANGSRVRPVIEDVGACSRDLVSSILAGKNWLASCAGTFRAMTVTSDYFDDLPRSREWTLIAFRLASTRHVRLLPQLTYRINVTPRSESQGGESYMRGAVDGMTEIAQRNRDPRYRRAIGKALAKAEHQLSSFYRISGDRRQAWEFHYRSMCSEDWWKYLPYTAILATGSRKKVPSILSQRERL